MRTFAFFGAMSLLALHAMAGDSLTAGAFVHLRLDGRLALASGVERVGYPDREGGQEWDTSQLPDGPATVRADEATAEMFVINSSARLHGGRLTSNECWRAGRHVVGHDVIVPSNVVLELDFDAKVELLPDVRIWIERGGRLQTSGALVTAFRDAAHEVEWWWDDPTSVAHGDYLVPSAECVGWRDCRLVKLSFASRFSESPEVRVATVGRKLVPVDVNPREGYSFMGWSLAGEMTGQETLVPESDAELVACWSANGYTVRFDANGGVGTMADQAFVYDAAEALTANAFVKTGYAFAGWTRDAATGMSPPLLADAEVVSNLTAAAGGTVTLYAKWTPNSYVVDFNPGQGGTGSMPDQPMTYDEAAALYANLFARTGYTFLGWADDEGELEEVLFYDGVVVSNLTDGVDGEYDLYAVWAANEYAVRFNANGGTGTMADQAFRYDEAQALRANGFARAGYKFAGWATSAGGTVKYADGASVKNLTAETDGVVTLYAKWTPENYNIVYELNGGVNAAGNPTTYTIEDAITLAAATRSGYEFRGWTPDGGKIAKGSTGDRRFSANWEVAGGGTVDPGPGPQPQPQPQPEPNPVPAVEIVEPVQAFVAPTQKAVLSGAVLGADGSVAGIVQLDVGKVSKKNESKVTVTIIGIDGKKMKSKAVQVATSAGLQRVTFNVKGYGPLTLDIGADGFIGEAGGETIASVRKGLATGGATVAFSLVKGYALDGLLTEYLPNGVKVTRTAKKWTLPKAGKLKYVKPNEKKGNAGGLTATGENISGLKLTYTAKTGVLKGSFKLWTFDEAKKKLKSVSAKVTGVVINGVGYSEATVKKRKIGDLTVD